MPHKIHFPHGFTLIEILISVAIISLVGIVFYPNLRKFNNDQLFKNEVLDIKNAIKKAQTNTTTGTRCSSAEAAINWSTVITPGTSLSTNVRSTCINSSQAQSVKNLDAISASNTQIQSSSCPSNNTIELKFERTGFSYICNSGTPVQGSFTLQLQNKNNTSQSITLQINSAGTISQN